MKIVVTGGCGYVGTELVHSLLSQPEVEEVTVFDNLSRVNRNFFFGSRKFDTRVKFVHADILDSRSLDKVFQGVNCCYHLAARVTNPFADDNAHLFEQVNNWGTAEVVYAIERSGVERLIYLSSASVYGESMREYTESDAVSPATAYGISKRHGERHVDRLFQKLASCYTVRSANVFGYSRSMRFDSVVNRLAFEANSKGQLLIHGDGSQRRTFVHVHRLANFLAALNRFGLASGVYNVGDATLAVNDIVEALVRVFPKLNYLYSDQDIPRRNLCIAMSRKVDELIQVPLESFEDSMRYYRQKFTFQAK